MDKEYSKDFDAWNESAKKLNDVDFSDFFHERDIWWCILGVNIGSEQDGKDEKFLRPVLVIKKISKDLLWILPFTSKVIKNAPYRILSGSTGITSQILVDQIRTISSKRLLRKIGTLKVGVFYRVLMRIAWTLLMTEKIETPP